MACDAIKLIKPVYCKFKQYLKKESIYLQEFYDKNSYTIDTKKMCNYILSIIDKNPIFQKDKYEDIEFK